MTDYPNSDDTPHQSFQQIDDDIRYVTTEADGSCGIGKYTQQLIESFENVRATKTTFDADTATILTYISLALKACMSGEKIIHVQFEYGLYCESICEKSNIPAVAAVLFFPLLRFLCFLHRKRIFTTVHTVHDSEDDQRPWYGAIYLRFLHSLIAWSSETVILLSEDSKADFERDKILGKIEDLPHGAELDESTYIPSSAAKVTFGYNKDETVIALPGYMEHRKGHRDFIHLAEQFPEYEFLIGGGARTETMESYEEEIRRQSGENVQITGTLEEERFKRVFQAADVVVLPYRDIDQSGIFNWCVVYETPIVAYDLPYFKRLQAGWGSVDVVPKNNGIKELASAVQHTIKSESHREKLKSGLRAYGKANSFQAVAKAHANLYQQTI
ncbi:glycosyltransferase [Halohasta salina]|uniref:glycosyltransferase n=1 Tax=Halohasta salina TaxID=2961621 RepID=UPI0020A4EF49|nr:glycosyltransferase [Halohasta salina]